MPVKLVKSNYDIGALQCKFADDGIRQYEHTGMNSMGMGPMSVSGNRSRYLFSYYNCDNNYHTYNSFLCNKYRYKCAELSV